MSEILFRMAAKTDVGLVRDNNEDNFQASADLAQAPMRWVNNQQYPLGDKGALLVVADGMGGMNAGEVASEIAINTVRELFAPERLTQGVMKTDASINKYLKQVVVEADRNIKQYARGHKESRGMGTTIVMAWMLRGKAYVCWCGDSRAYIYNPATGLYQLSKDHSYVQQLVDDGKIAPEDAFDFPDSNIITRSLSDGAPKAAPDCLPQPHTLCNGDIVLLCSDGLNGMIHDEEIQAIVASCQNDMTMLVDQLIDAAKAAAGADNVTVALAQFTSGCATPTPMTGDGTPVRRRGSDTLLPGQQPPADNGGSRASKWPWALFVAAICTLGAFAVYKFFPREPEPKLTDLSSMEVVDTTQNAKPDTTAKEEEKPDTARRMPALPPLPFANDDGGTTDAKKKNTHKNNKGSKDNKGNKDSKESKDDKGRKDNKESKDPKDGQDAKDNKDKGKGEGKPGEGKDDELTPINTNN